MRSAAVLFLGSLALPLTRGHQSGSSPVQYCRVDSEKGVDVCFTFALYRNSSSKGNDLYIRTSTRFQDRAGWSAVGTGATMSRALMFIFYPASAHSDDATVSLRTTAGHNPPKPAENAPNYDVLNVSVQNEYYDISIVCYSCDEWGGQAIDVNSEAQAMIYATQVHEKMQTTDKAASLSFHTDYKHFKINVHQLHAETALPVPPAFANNGRKTTGLDGRTSQNNSLYMYHGILMIVSYTVLMPLAVVYLRSGMPKAFTVHWVIQVTATTIAFSSATFAIVKSWDSFEMKSQVFLSQHLTLGTLITVFLPLQPVLGHRRHVYYVKLQRRTLISHFHIWVGRTLILFAWINTGLGLKLAHTISTYVIYWFIMVGLMSLAMIWAPTIPAGVKNLRTSGKAAVYRPLDPET